jgi:hypothetical protein
MGRDALSFAPIAWLVSASLGTMGWNALSFARRARLIFFDGGHGEQWVTFFQVISLSIFSIKIFVFFFWGFSNV